MHTIGQSQRMPVDEILMRLLELPFFAPVNQKWLRQMAEDKGRLRSFSAGEVVFSEGTHGEAIYVILKGSVLLHVPAGFGQMEEDGKIRLASLPIKVLSRGGTTLPGVAWDPQQVWFGEGAALGQTVRPYTVEALGDLLVLEINKVHIQHLAGLSGTGLLDELRQHADRSAIEVFILGHRAFADIEPAEMRALTSNSRLRYVDRGQEVFVQGASSKTVFLVKSGVLRLVQGSQDAEYTLAYYSSGDIVGTSDRLRRAGTLNAMGFSELVEVPRSIFDEVARGFETRSRGWLKQFEKVDTSDREVVKADVSRGTLTVFMDEFMQDGGELAQSLMTINLDTCIRCGNCVRACEARHEHPKMVRRGKKLTRSVQALGGRTDHQEVMLTSSCRHCETPECMVGCPTGAIHRKSTGEVAVHDFCIGCSNCALRCPWDNITMVPLAEAQHRPDYGIMVDRIASKCDLCFGYTEANCVNNCPTEAILRISPHEYFPELKERLGKSGKAIDPGRRTETSVRTGRGRVVVWSVGGMTGVGLISLWASATPFTTVSPQGLALGIFALLFFIASTALAMRRRMAHRGRISPRATARERDEERTRRAELSSRDEHVPNTGRAQAGPFHLWMKAHPVLGLLAVLATLLHADFSAGAALTATLLMLMALVALTGVLGVIFSKWVPRVTTRIEGEAQLEEDVAQEKGQVAEGISAFIAMADSSEAKAAGGILTSVSVFSILRRGGKNLDSIRSSVEARFRSAAPGLAAPEVDSGVALAMRRAELAALTYLYRARRAWLGVHIGVTAALLTATLVHVVVGLQIFGAL